MRVYGLTNKGRQREKNEDCFDIILNYADNAGLENALLIADGMGGHQAGEVASKTAIEAFSAYIGNAAVKDEDLMDFLTEALKYANTQVYQLSLSDGALSGMGTTFTACAIRNNKGFAVHVGDSRLYVIGKNGMRLVTSDHSYVNEMVRAGQITEEEALTHPNRNALTRAVGVGPDVEVDGYIFELSDDDKVLLCTDGLTNMVGEEVIYHTIINAGELSKCAEDLIDIANQNGGMDNLTVVLAEIKR